MVIQWSTTSGHWDDMAKESIKERTTKEKEKATKARVKERLQAHERTQEKATEEATDRQEKEKERTTTEEKTTTKEKAKDQFATSAIAQGILLEIAGCQSTRFSSRMTTVTMLHMTGTMAAMTIAGTATMFTINNRPPIQANNLHLSTLHSSKQQLLQDNNSRQSPTRLEQLTSLAYSW